MWALVQEIQKYHMHTSLNKGNYTSVVLKSKLQYACNISDSPI